MKFEETYADNYKDCAWIPFEDLETFMREALVNAGIPADDAKTIGEVLIESDKRGIDSHGIGRLKPIYIDRIDKGIMNPVTEIEVIKDQDATAVLDGHNGLGHVVSKKAMEMAIEKAKKYGIGMVAVRNSTHYGIAGYYPLMATKANMIGITGTNARPSIAPTNGVENMMGTNPLTFGIPTDEEFPFIL
ncbi:MAG: Ldh family oxidoreductase, partial [Sphaerochaetaceae bacterium]|nr:Ldh family oxidoreductase [Sphaerochaetaceae bacterium]